MEPFVKTNITHIDVKRPYLHGFCLGTERAFNFFLIRITDATKHITTFLALIETSLKIPVFHLILIHGNSLPLTAVITVSSNMNLSYWML